MSALPASLTSQTEQAATEEQWQALMQRLPGNDVPWLMELREASLELYLAGRQGLLRDERWKYARLPEPLLNASAKGERPSLQAVALPVEATRLTFIDGRFAPELSDILPEGLEFRLLSYSWEDADIQRHLRTSHGHAADALDALSLASASEGLELHLLPETVLALPLHLQFIQTQAASFSWRHRWQFGFASRATIIESHYGTAASWALHRQQIELEENAQLQHVVLQQEAVDATHLARRLVTQQGFSHYALTVLSLGGETARQEVIASLKGAEAKTEIACAHLAGGRQQHSHYVLADHAAPHGHSDQQFRSVLDGSARGAFFGKVKVPEAITHSEAHQLLRSLLLSRSAEADLRPELEILNDEVVCSHGAAVGEIDRQALYYLQARGISAVDARKLLINAFILSLLEDRLSAELVEHCQQLVEDWVESAGGMV